MYPAQYKKNKTLKQNKYYPIVCAYFVFFICLFFFLTCFVPFQNVLAILLCVCCMCVYRTCFCFFSVVHSRGINQFNANFCLRQQIGFIDQHKYTQHFMYTESDFCCSIKFTVNIAEQQLTLKLNVIRFNTNEQFKVCIVT